MTRTRHWHWSFRLLAIAALATLPGCATLKRWLPGDDDAGSAEQRTLSSTASTETLQQPAKADEQAAEARRPLDLSVPRKPVPDATPGIAYTAADGSKAGSTGDDWAVDVHQAIARAWLRPRGPRIPDDFSCDVLVKLTRSGVVEEARIARSCGHPSLDASVLSAVQAASPLPLPRDMADFSDTLLLTFTPR